MQWIAFLVAASLFLGLRQRMQGGSTRVTLLLVVGFALGGLYLFTLR